MTAHAHATDAMSGQQLGLLRAMSQLRPVPFLFGGYAEDALLAGTVTRPHLDIDWICPRRELKLRLDQARGLGFTEFEVWGEAAPGAPFYLHTKQGDLLVDIGVSDESGGHNHCDVHRLAFEIDDAPAPAGYRILLADDMYEHPPVRLDGIELSVISPLALHQIRIGIASQGSFGPLSERQRETSRRLRAAYFPGVPEQELVPRIERL